MPGPENSASMEELGLNEDGTEITGFSLNPDEAELLRGSLDFTRGKIEVSRTSADPDTAALIMQRSEQIKGLLNNLSRVDQGEAMSLDLKGEAKMVAELAIQKRLGALNRTIPNETNEENRNFLLQKTAQLSELLVRLGAV